MSGNKKHTLQKMMNSICWAMRTWSPLLDLWQTLRVLLTIYFLLHHAPSSCVLSHCLVNLWLKLSFLPQVQPYNRKSSPNSKNPWVLSLTSNYESKWGFSRLLCLRQWSLSKTNFSLSKRRLKKWRWIRLPLQILSLVSVNKLRIWTIPLRDLRETQPSAHTDEAMEVDLYGPPLPPRLGDDHSMHDSDPRQVSDQHSGQYEEPFRVVGSVLCTHTKVFQAL